MIGIRQVGKESVLLYPENNNTLIYNIILFKVDKLKIMGKDY